MNDAHELAAIPPFEHDPAGPRVVFGLGIAERAVAEEVERLQLHRVLLIASSRERSVRAELVASLGPRVVANVSQIARHVPVDVARDATDTARGSGADGIVCIGGGSATGLAKAVALETGLPILAVPTTYAGSEVTPVHGVTQDGHKRTGRSPQVLPRVVVYDPVLGVGQSLTATSASVANALAHCVGSFYSPSADPISAALASEAMGALVAGAHRVVTDLDDLAARSHLTYGAYLAGTVFASTGSSFHHAVCHVLGGAYDLPHAETHAALLPATFGVMRAHLPGRDDRIARALDVPSSGAEDALRRLLDTIGEGSFHLGAIGLSDSDLTGAVDLLVERLPRGGVTPSPTELHSMLKAAL